MSGPDQKAGILDYVVRLLIVLLFILAGYMLFIVIPTMIGAIPNV